MTNVYNNHTFLFCVVRITDRNRTSKAQGSYIDRNGFFTGAFNAVHESFDRGHRRHRHDHVHIGRIWIAIREDFVVRHDIGFCKWNVLVDLPFHV